MIIVVQEENISMNRRFQWRRNDKKKQMNIRVYPYENDDYWNDHDRYNMIRILNRKENENEFKQKISILLWIE